jgi:exonuclease VII small subunit
MTSDATAAEIGALYALPAEEFVAARNALVKRLKADKRKDEAAEVAALRRPSVVAWALNHVARDDPDAVAILVEAAQGVADAQRAVMDGGDPKALRAASAAQRGAAAEVTAAAVRLAGANNANAVAATVDAALADEDLTARLRAGTLTETLDAPAGFGFGIAVEEAGSTSRRRAARTGRPEASAGTASAATSPRAAAPDQTDELAERRVRAEARKAIDRLERDLERADDAVDAATAALERATTELGDAEAALAAAETQVSAATAARNEASAALEDALSARDGLALALDDARSD